MESEFISSKSIQGSFQDKYFRNNLSLLDNLIDVSLTENNTRTKITDGRKTKTNRYDIGTVAKITFNNERYYFLAVADVNKYGKPNAKYENIYMALDGLWNFLLYSGHIETLIIPVIGTGRTGIVDATRMNVIKDIISSFVAISSNKKITNNLVLCIYPQDLIDGKINITEVYEYVNYLSKYK